MAHNLLRGGGGVLNFTTKFEIFSQNYVKCILAKNGFRGKIFLIILTFWIKCMVYRKRSQFLMFSEMRFYSHTFYQAKKARHLEGNGDMKISIIL